MTYFKENEHISVKLQISVLLSKFHKRALYRLQFLHRKLSIFTKLPDFNEITDFQEIKEITDFNQFSRDSLPPFGDITDKILYIHKMNRFQGISCLISKEILLVKNTNFSNQMLYCSVSNEQISRDFLLDIKRATFG